MIINDMKYLIQLGNGEDWIVGVEVFTHIMTERDFSIENLKGQDYNIVYDTNTTKINDGDGSFVHYYATQLVEWEDIKIYLQRANKTFVDTSANEYFDLWRNHTFRIVA